MKNNELLEFAKDKAETIDILRKTLKRYYELREWMGRNPKGEVCSIAHRPLNETIKSPDIINAIYLLIEQEVNKEISLLEKKLENELRGESVDENRNC